MEAKAIAGIGRRLKHFLRDFRDCFGRREPREHLEEYVHGQVSNLQRKSIEPMALETGTPPRTLQQFLESIKWDEVRMRDQVQQIVARDHADPQAIGTIDESGHPKKGRHTAAVKRQWCGRTGKIDNCVISVHLGYVAGDFQCILDSDVYLPEDWAADLERRRKVYIPDDVVYRKKTDIALDQVRRALGNGIRVAAWTFDEWYGRDREFLVGMERLGQDYVGEVPSNFVVWLKEPRVLFKPRPQDLHGRGKRKRFPRLARQTPRACEARNLLTYSRIFQRQDWQRYRIKNGEKGPIVWEVKHAPCYIPGADKLPGPAHTLIVARNVMDPSEIKYFLSNRRPNSKGWSLKWMLWVAFARWSIEHCFRQAKDELGMDHFEVRGWRCIHRHFYITQVSHLFCSREHQRLGEKNDGHGVPDRRAGPPGGRCLVRGPLAPARRPLGAISGERQANRLLPAAQQGSAAIAHQDNPPAPPPHGHQAERPAVLHTPHRLGHVAL
jgi:SRSO17 transposase